MAASARRSDSATSSTCRCRWMPPSARPLDGSHPRGAARAADTQLLVGTARFRCSGGRGARIRRGRRTSRGFPGSRAGRGSGRRPTAQGPVPGSEEAAFDLLAAPRDRRCPLRRRAGRPAAGCGASAPDSVYSANSMRPTAALTSGRPRCRRRNRSRPPARGAPRATSRPRRPPPSARVMVRSSLRRALRAHPVPGVHGLAGDDRGRHAAEVPEERRAAEPADAVGRVRARDGTGSADRRHPSRRGARRRGPWTGSARRRPPAARS